MEILNTNPNCMLGFWCYYEKSKSVIRNYLSVVDTSRFQVGQFCPPQLQSSFHHRWLRPHIRTQVKKTECSPTGMVLRTLLFSDVQRSTPLVPLSGICWYPFIKEGYVWKVLSLKDLDLITLLMLKYIKWCSELLLYIWIFQLWLLNTAVTLHS